jgi:hypothetical protein
MSLFWNFVDYEGFNLVTVENYDKAKSIILSDGLYHFKFS